ncbi:MAG: peptidylprolyl isomerase [Planctomycetes bacterium]|nr:peptidylprolyl isomerase [Planctomycetota bacterium]
MAKAKEGDTVRVHYTGRFDDGEVFDSSADGDPLEFTMGEGGLIAGFEAAVLGMDIGESKTVEIAPEDGYGPHMKELVMTVERSDLPPDLEPEVGMQLRSVQDDGREMLLVVTAVGDDGVTLDANHPLAGRALTFDIQLVEIV